MILAGIYWPDPPDPHSCWLYSRGWARLHNFLCYLLPPPPPPPPPPLTLPSAAAKGQMGFSVLDTLIGCVAFDQRARLPRPVKRRYRLVWAVQVLADFPRGAYNHLGVLEDCEKQRDSIIIRPPKCGGKLGWLLEEVNWPGR